MTSQPVPPPDEIRAAFAHPEARAGATAGTAFPDRISLRDHLREVEIGAFQLERGVTQRLAFDLVVEVRGQGDAGDDVDRILSYDRLTEAIDAELSAERLNLLETLAERIAARILREPRALRAFVRIQKLDRGPGALGVEIVRGRDGASEPDAAPDAPRPRVVVLGAEATAAPLSPMLDRLAEGGLPLVLCVGLPDAPGPKAATPGAQRRIDLLGLDQAAWALASRDGRCLVAATRTELDWALRHGHVGVWAPSKLVLDAVDGPEGQDGPALAAWLAGELGAAELRLIGPEPPPRAPVPVATGTPEAPLG